MVNNNGSQTWACVRISWLLNQTAGPYPQIHWAQVLQVLGPGTTLSTGQSSSSRGLFAQPFMTQTQRLPSWPKPSLVPFEGPGSRHPDGT